MSSAMVLEKTEVSKNGTLLTYNLIVGFYMIPINIKSKSKEGGKRKQQTIRPL
jgi:hypothetical protein